MSHIYYQVRKHLMKGTDEHFKLDYPLTGLAPELQVHTFLIQQAKLKTHSFVQTQKEY